MVTMNIMHLFDVYFILYEAVESDKAEIFVPDAVLGEDSNEVKKKIIETSTKVEDH